MGPADDDRDGTGQPTDEWLSVADCNLDMVGLAPWEQRALLPAKGLAMIPRGPDLPWLRTMDKAQARAALASEPENIFMRWPTEAEERLLSPQCADDTAGTATRPSGPACEDWNHIRKRMEEIAGDRARAMNPEGTRTEPALPPDMRDDFDDLMIADMLDGHV